MDVMTENKLVGILNGTINGNQIQEGFLGRAYGNPILGVGVHGRALSFDGRNQWVDLGSLQ